LAKQAKNIKKQGEEGENSFAAWLNQEKIGYLYIQQEFEFFAEVFRNAVKRPDFLVLLPNIGFIAVDVKNHTFNKKYNGFTLDIEDIAKAFAFEKMTRQYLWYAYKKLCSDDLIWYFISAQDIFEYGKKRTSKENGDFLFIAEEHFTTVQKEHDMSKLFQARIGKLGRMARFIEHGFNTIKL